MPSISSWDHAKTSELDLRKLISSSLSVAPSLVPMLTCFSGLSKGTSSSSSVGAEDSLLPSLGTFVRVKQKSNSRKKITSTVYKLSIKPILELTQATFDTLKYNKDHFPRGRKIGTLVTDKLLLESGLLDYNPLVRPVEASRPNSELAMVCGFSSSVKRRLTADLKVEKERIANGVLLEEALRQHPDFDGFAKDFSDAGFKFLMKGIAADMPHLQIDLGDLKKRYAKKWASGLDGTPGPQSLVDKYARELDFDYSDTEDEDAPSQEPADVGTTQEEVPSQQGRS
ncbi:uncharacterized protein LOC111025046 [Momordica charantia]|uniref:Uncharacterized protein LOC111025046 n=1 Tax=Momordica charantia TaxID=3673 RepID=A0A6J1DW92_MOMCH|nr:uncharacterized protein LOC111025046 [Momordica charantia]